jgi:hypothetical protein
MTLFGRPDLKDFKVDTIYRNSLTDELVKFIGMAGVPELAGQDVAIFRSVEGGGLFAATQEGYNQGERFEEAGEAMVEEAAYEDP